MNKYQWPKEEWEKFLPKLEKLSRDELVELARKTGVIFDEPEKVSKEEFLLTLDETNSTELKNVYEDLLARK